MRIAISGASGFIGSALASALRNKGHEVIAIVRRKDLPSTIFYNPELGLIDAHKLENFDVVINLAGQNVRNKRWTPQFKTVLRDSRIDCTKTLANAIARLKHPPRLFLSASATGYYGDRGDEILSESAAPGTDFLAQLCREWELATWEAQAVGVRVNHLRFGVVLAREGGALKQMLMPFRFGLGAMLGSGEQYFPWVTLEDLIRAVVFLIENPQPSGPFNIVAPNPVTNKEFTRVLAKTLHRPTFLKLSRAMIHRLFGEMGETLLLSSTRTVPEQLSEAGFVFSHTDIEEALHSAITKKSAHGKND